MAIELDERIRFTIQEFGEMKKKLEKIENIENMKWSNYKDTCSHLGLKK